MFKPISSYIHLRELPKKIWDKLNHYIEPKILYPLNIIHLYSIIKLKIISSIE